MTNTLTRLAMGRAIARKSLPYLYNALLSLVPIEVSEPGATFFVTKGLVMGYNPSFVATLNNEELAGVLLHEVSHVVRNTPWRMPEGDPYLKNLAADIAINADLKRSGVTILKTCVFPETFGVPEGRTMEIYYGLLKDAVKPPPTVCAGQCGGIGGNGNSELEEELDRKYGRPNLDVRIVRESCLKALSASSMYAGHISSDLQMVLDVTLGSSKVSWRHKLRSLLTKSTIRLAVGAVDFSLRRPSTRSLARNDNVVRPGLIDYEPNILLCLDVSGSMGDKELTVACTEIAAVLKAIRVHQIHLLQADADITRKPELISINDLRHLRVTGRGGTDFAPALSYAEKMKPRPDLLIYFTDGLCYSTPSKPKGIDVVMCIVPSEYTSSVEPIPWAKTIVVEGRQ